MTTTSIEASEVIVKASQACREAQRDGMLPLRDPSVLTGFSGRRLIGTLQRLVSIVCSPTEAYVEIGVFQGLTLLSVAGVNPDVPCIGIDNFSQFDRDGRNEAIIHDRAQRLQVTNSLLVHDDYERALHRAEEWLDGRKIGLLFIDGPHDYRAQLLGLLLGERLLSTDGVMVVDDANYAHVRRATADFLSARMNFALLMQAYTPAHPDNMMYEQREEAEQGWWNGAHVIVQDPSRSLPRLSVPTSNDDLHAMTHKAFGMEFAEFMNDALRLTHAMAGNNPKRTQAEMAALVPKLHQHRAAHSERYSANNTYSDKLVGFELAAES